MPPATNSLRKSREPNPGFIIKGWPMFREFPAKLASGRTVDVFRKLRFSGA
jgi:hypothetical protein